MRRSVLLALAACGGSPAEPSYDTVPCDAPEWWQHSVRAETHPIEVHFPDGIDAARAREVAALLDEDWTIEVGAMSFRAPLEGAPCGSDDAVDVFLWPGQEEAYVEAIADVPATPEDDWTTILVLDPDGEFGGDALPTTLAHELNHMCQAADDWNESIAILEATATHVEARIVPEGGARAITVADFQAHPEWSPDHDDGYETWFMYGASLYLEVLRSVYFDDHESFPGSLWQRMRALDWADALRDAVAPATLDDTIVALTIARWDEPVATPPSLAVAPGTITLDPIEPLGARYLELDGTATVDHPDARVVDVAPGVVAIVYLPPGYDPADPPPPITPTVTLTPW